MYVLRVITHCFFVKLLFMLYFVSITTHEDVSDKESIEDNLQELSNEALSVSYLSQKIIIYPCPDDFQNVNDLCILFKYNTTYPPECPFEETVSFDNYIDQIRLASPIWMPVRRDKRMNGIGLFHWTERNSLYRSLFDPCKEKSCVFLNTTINDCVIYHNESTMEAVPCNQRATAICAYDHLQKKKKSFCSQSLSTACQQSDFSTKSKCFCKLPTTDLEKAEFLTPYQNLVYHSMTNEMCYIGLKNTGTSFIWTSSKLPVDYQYWAVETYPTADRNTFGAISSDGWTLMETESELNCTLYQQNIPQSLYIDDMFLDFDYNTEKFILKLTNSTNWLQRNDSALPLVFCSSDASAESLLEMIEAEYSEETGEFWFEPISNRSGNYWCEGFLYPELKLKTSNEYNLQKDMEEYVVVLNFTYGEDSDPLSTSNLKRYKQSFDQVLDQPEISFYTRIYKITGIDTAGAQSTICVNFHVTTDNKATDMANVGVIRNILNNPSEDFRFSFLLSVHFCFTLQVSHNGQRITWASIRIGEIAENPLEGWCVNDEGYILKRRCEGNFVDGAQWAEFQGICTIVSSTNATINITSIVSSEDPIRYLDQMVDLTANYNDFGSEDVALVSDFLEQLTNISTTNIESVSKIVNNLGNIPLDILKESQSDYKTTDKILESVEEIIRWSSYLGTILGETLSIASFESSSNNTLILIKDIDPIEIEFSIVLRPEDVEKDKHFDSALIMKEFSPTSSDVIKVLIYSKPIFFGEENDSESTRTIYRILPRGGDLGDVSIVYQTDLNDSAIYYHRCSSWNYFLSNESIGYWKYQAKSEHYMNHIICNSNYDAYSRLHSIQFVGTTSVTTELVRIKESQFSSQYSKLAELRDLVITFSNLLESTDLHHIYEILNLVESVEEGEFNLIADVIDTILDMNEDVLSKSQSLLNVPELLLENLTKLMSSYGTSIEMSRKNFFLLVFFINITADTEFIINTCSEFCSCVIVSRTDTDPTKVFTKEVEMSIVISRDLVNQLRNMNDSKLLLTVFNDNALFISKNSNIEDHSKIVGVHFSDFHEAMRGEIKIEYQINDAIVNRSCEYWQDTNWVPNGDTTEMNHHFSQCHFWNMGYYSLRFNVINITFFIEENLKIDDVTVILENIEEVLVKYHDRFSEYDLYLITNVLEKIVTVEEKTLRIICKIVSIITNMNRDILNESQEKYRTTDRLLNYFDKLSGMLELNDVYYYSDSNLFVISSYVKQSAIVGIQISNCKIDCRIDQLFENDTSVNISKNLDMTSIKLSQDLFSGLLGSTSEPKVIIKAFYNDALFNARHSIGHTGIIFGIQILGNDLVLENEIVLTANSLTEGYCVRWNNPLDENKIGTWQVEGRMDNLTCNFQQQGYLSNINKDITANITKILESLRQSSPSNIDHDVQEIIGISYLYDEFESIDVFILSDILLIIMDSDIDVLGRIFENMLSISKDVLIQSQTEYNISKNVFAIINSIGNHLALNTSYTIKNQLSLIVCSVDTRMSAVFDEKLNSWCTKSQDDDYSGRISISDDLITDIIAAFDEKVAPKFIFTLFHDNTFFLQDDEYVSFIIFGLNIPNYNGTLRNELIISLDETKSKREVYTCAYWEYVVNSFGIWWPVTAQNAGAHKTCSFSQGEYFSLIRNDTSRNITEILQEIDDSIRSYHQKLHHTLDIIDLYKDQFEPLHISIISKIVRGGYVLFSNDLVLIGTITNSLMGIDRTVLVQSQNLYNATHQMLHHIDTLVTRYVQDDTFIQFDNFAVLVQSNFSKIHFENCTESCIIEIITEESEDSRNIDAILSIDQELRKYVDENFLKIHITVYFNDVLFNEGFIEYTSNFGIIVGVTIPGLEESNWNGSVRFGLENRSDKADMCSYWKWNQKAQNGSFIQRGHWEITSAHLDSKWVCTNRIDSTHFAVLEIGNNATSDLENILNSSSPIGEQLYKVNCIINTNTHTLSAMDIFLIAKILGKVAGYEVTTQEHVLYISKIVSSLFKVERATLRESQKMYFATDTILHNLDQILLRRQVTEPMSDLIIEDNFTVITYELSNTDIRGLRLEGCDNTTCNLTVLHKNTSIIDIVDYENLNTALLLSDDILLQIKNSEYPVYLIVTVFFEDIFFNEKTISNYSRSIISGVLLKGLNESLHGNISMIHKTNTEERYDNASCAYWNYKVTKQEGYWKRDVVPRNEKHAMVCDHTHITHFVLLLANSGSVVLEKNQSEILDMITNINSILSLFGIFGILLTALLFDRWRNNTGNQILIHFSFAISIKNVMLYISVGVWDENGGSSMACTITGGILHYSILSEFGWMLIIAILQFKRFVEVLGSPTKYILLKACICGWAFPAIPVFLIIIIDVNNYSAGRMGLCYPSGLGLYLGIWLPLIIIIFINTIIFIVIIFNVFHKKTESRDQVNHEILFQWRLALLLFFMLGLTWLFGFLSLSGEYFFMIVFCFFATLQGFVMFMFFIVFNKSTRVLYIQMFRLWLYSNGYSSKLV